MDKVKIEVGQIWKSPTTDSEYTISRLDDQHAYYYSRLFQKDNFFGYIDSDGYGLWDGGWLLIFQPAKSPIPETKKVSEVGFKETLDFFRSTGPGNCACGIPKHQCDYHASSR